MVFIQKQNVSTTMQKDLTFYRAWLTFPKYIRHLFLYDLLSQIVAREKQCVEREAKDDRK
jgi:hypothetical protein